MEVANKYGMIMPGEADTQAVRAVFAEMEGAASVAILFEAGLSFLGLGLRPPITSWGVLLNEAQNINVVALYPWLMLPVLPVLVVVLAFNFLGDGLRDAADPYN